METVAGLAAAALGTALPLGSLAKLVSEFAFADRTAAEEWEGRFVISVRGWLQEHAATLEQTVGGACDGWEDKLLQEFNEGGVGALLGSDRSAQEEAVELIAAAMFVPFTSSGWDASRDAARALLEDLPELLLQAAGPQGELLALRRVLGTDLGEVLSALDEVSQRFPARLSDQATIATYLAALPAALNSDPWARVIGGTDQTLEASFLDRRVRWEDDEQAHRADDVADRCERLVVLAEPGAGKSWLARHIALRAANLAEVQLDDRRSDALESVEIPLWARAASVLDAPEGVSPWEAVVRMAAEGLDDLIGMDGAAALRDRLARRSGRYLIVLDGLDEAVRVADPGRLERLVRTPGRDIRLVITSRPGAWRFQLPMAPSRGPRKALLPERAHAVVKLQLLSDDEVRETVSSLLEGQSEARVGLLQRLDSDEQLSVLARIPLICAMLSVLVLRTGAIARTQTELFSAVVTLLLRSTWRGERQDDAVAEARRNLQQAVADSAHTDPYTGLARLPQIVTVAPATNISQEALACVDGIAPVATFDPMATAQARRFIHARLCSHILAEHIAGLDPQAAAASLRDHLWFDPDWENVTATSLALHPHRGQVLRLALDVGPADELQWRHITRLDGFGEIRRLLCRLALETPARAWDESARAVIIQAAHEVLADQPQSPVRLELLRGGWPDDRTRAQHLAALAGAASVWPDRDLTLGIASLELTRAEREAAIGRLLKLLAQVSTLQLRGVILTLDALYAGDFESERSEATEMVLRRAAGDPLGTVDALLEFDLSSDQRRRAAGYVLSELLRLEEALLGGVSWWDVETLVRGLMGLTDDPALLEQGAHRVLAMIADFDKVEGLQFCPGGIALLRREASWCATVIEYVLRSTAGLDSYDVRHATALVHELGPPSEHADAVLRLLFDFPLSTWPRQDVFLEFVGRVARSMELGSREALVATIVGRLASADLIDLDPLSRLVELLDPVAHARDRAADQLLTRLRATPSEVILSCASGIRNLSDPAPGEEAARVVCERLADVSDPALRQALATGVLQLFPSSQAAREMAVQELLAHVGAERVAFDVAQWGRSEHASREARSLILTRLIQLIRDRGAGDDSVAEYLPAIAVNDDERRAAIDALLDRARDDPVAHTYDWVLPAVRLGASAERCLEATQRVVDALSQMELDDGMSYTLERGWREIPLSLEQRRAAGCELVNRLVALDSRHARSVCRLLDELQPSPELRARAIGILRGRVHNERSEVLWLAPAIAILDPSFRVSPSQSELLDAVRKNFTLSSVRDFTGSGPSESARREMLAVVIHCCSSRFVSSEAVELIADELGIAAEDLRVVAATPQAREPGVRALARSARRRCTGDHWRAFLAEAGTP